MKLKGKPVTALLFSILLFSTAGAASLGFGVTTITPDTLPMGDTYIVSTSLINYDSVSYYGTVALDFELNGARNADAGIFPNPLAGSIVNLGPGDSIHLSIVVFVSPAYFEAGPDIFVVWPISQDASPPHNVFSGTVYVLSTVDIHEIYGVTQLKIFYALKSVFIQNISPNMPLNRVIIFNDLGQQILSNKMEGQTNLPFDREPAGVYFVRAEFTTGQTRLFKIVKL